MIDTTLVCCGYYSLDSKTPVFRYLDEGDGNRELLFGKNLFKTAALVGGRYRISGTRNEAGKLVSIETGSVQFVNRGDDNLRFQELKPDIVLQQQKQTSEKAEKRLSREYDMLGNMTLFEVRNAVKKSFGSNRQVWFSLILEFISR